MNALEAIRKKESDHKARIAALEAQIAKDGAHGYRDITILNQLDDLNKTQPVTEDERLKAFNDHGLPVIKAYMEPFITALREARAAYLDAYAEYAAAEYKAETAALAWGRNFYPRRHPNACDIKPAEMIYPEVTVGSVLSCDDVQITE